jgi:hypothetical protein
MSDISVNLNPVSLDVYGGPASIDVSLDYGRQGERGSKIWVGNGGPVQTLSGQDIKVGDLFINTNTTDQFYSWLYVYTESVAGPAWETALRLNPSQYSVISSTSFNSEGVATILIPMTEITRDTAIFKEQFTVRYSIENTSSDPVASSFEYDIATIPDAQDNDIVYLRIIISAVKYSGSTWSSLVTENSNTKVHLFISYLS